MTQMLARVTSVAEAEAAIAGGADIVGVEFGAGMAAIVRAVTGRAETSVALAPPSSGQSGLEDIIGQAAAAGADQVEIDARLVLEFTSGGLLAAAGRARLLAVLSATHAGEAPGLLPKLAALGFRRIAIDAPENHGRLLDLVSPGRIPGLVEQARALGLETAFSGSLEAPDIPRLLPFRPVFLGFRGALRQGALPDAALDPVRMEEIRGLIPSGRNASPRASPPAPAAAMAATRLGALGTDKVFVRGFVLPVEIGAYRFEHGHAQKVRFDVTADVLRQAGTPEDMRDVFSYDIILDGIRTIVAAGHVDLVETLAEKIAAQVLAQPRVAKVTVRVEKLEIGPDGVGVEIERMRDEHGSR